MGDQQFQVFLSCGMFLCAAMIVVSLLRVKSRGPSAYFLALGFAVMGVLLIGFRLKWPAPTLGVVGLAVVACLVGDFILRAVKGQQKP
jgi:hypothetical protein